MPNFLQHPQRVVAFSLVYRRRSGDGTQPIRAIGAFSVQLKPDSDVTFERHLFVYHPEDYISPGIDMLRLVDKRTDTLAAVGGPSMRRMLVFGDPDVDVREQRALPILRDRRHRRAHFIRLNPLVIRAVASEQSIDIAKPDADEAVRASHAAEQAQAIWLSWLTLMLRDEPDCAGIVAAYQAYARLDQLRPIPF